MDYNSFFLFVFGKQNNNSMFAYPWEINATIIYNIINILKKKKKLIVYVFSRPEKSQISKFHKHSMIEWRTSSCYVNQTQNQKYKQNKNTEKKVLNLVLWLWYIIHISYSCCSIVYAYALLKCLQKIPTSMKQQYKMVKHVSCRNTSE